MGDILEYSRDFRLPTFLSEQEVLQLLHSLVYEVVPCARVAVEHGWRLDILSAVWLTPLALERIVCVAACVATVLE